METGLTAPIDPDPMIPISRSLTFSLSRSAMVCRWVWVLKESVRVREHPLCFSELHMTSAEVGTHPPLVAVAPCPSSASYLTSVIYTYNEARG